MEKVDNPPAYTSTGTSSKAQAHIITLIHCEPGALRARGRIFTGPEIERQSVAISIHPEVSYDEMVKLLDAHVLAHFKIELSFAHWKATMGLRRIGGSPGISSMTTLAPESWVAGRELLVREGSEFRLELWFAEVPEGYAGPTVVEQKKKKEEKKGGKCAVM